MEQINSYKMQFQRMKKAIHDHVFKPDPVAHQMPKEKMEPALKHAVEHGQPNKATFIALSQSSIIRGGLVGAILTSLIGFNAGKYSRLGAVRKRISFTRKFIVPLKKPNLIPFTNYFYPNLKTVTRNFMCFSGEAGIGKSYHFQHVAYMQSLIRPALYLSFKSTGRNATFEQDLAIKLQYGGGQNPPMLSEIISSIRRINKINQKPYILWTKVLLTHFGFIWAAHAIIQSQLLDANQGLFLGMLGTAYVYYFYMVYPFIIQSFRRTKPLIIFDDVNKIDDIGMLSQIARYLQLIDFNMSNIVLVSSDQQTWFKLRKQPGLKDRLRQRLITYNHQYTAEQILAYIQDDRNYQKFIKSTRTSPLYTKQLVVMLVKELIGNRQVTVRRLASLLILNDEEQYEKFVKVLVSYRENTMDIEQAVVKYTDILYNSEMETLCAKLKHVRRELKMPEEEFLMNMRLLLDKGMLMSDNKLGPFLMSYNIVRDCKSEYVFNGKFMYTVFQMAYQEYLRDMKEYLNQNPRIYAVDSQYQGAVLASRQQQGYRRGAQPDQDTTQYIEKAKFYDKNF